MTHHTPAHPVRQHWLSCWWVRIFWQRSLPRHGHNSVQLKPCSWQIQPRLHTDLPLQLCIRSSKKSDNIIRVKRTGSRPLLPFCQPKSKGDLTGGLARWDVIQTVACKLDLSTCCLKDGSLGGIREREACCYFDPQHVKIMMTRLKFSLGIV